MHQLDLIDIGERDAPVATKRPAYKNMDQCCLVSGFELEGEQPIFLDIAPTVKNITHGSHRYFRMSNTWGSSIETGKTHGVYLREDYGARLKVRHGILTLEEAGCEPPPPRPARTA